MTAMIDIILGTITEPVIHGLMHFLWQGSLIGLLLAGVLILVRPRSAVVRYRLACGALMIMILLPMATATRFAHRDTGHQSRSTTTSSEAAPVATDQEIRNRAQALPVEESTSGLAGPILRDVAIRMDGPDVTRWIFMTWLAGVFVFSAMHIGGWFRVRRLRRLQVSPIPEQWRSRAADLCRRVGINRSVKILCSAAVDVPTVIGWLKPVVLVPVSAFSGLPTQQLECILAHELAHIRRQDYLVNLLQICAETLLFFHPAVWWVSRQIRIERENCCDDIAVSLAGNRLLYARALVDLEELRLASPRLAMGADGGSLTWRVKRLIGGTDMSLQYKNSQLAGTLAALIMLIGVSAISLSAQPEFDDVVAMASGKQSTEETGRGRWFAEIIDGRLMMELSQRRGSGRRNNHWQTSDLVDIDEFKNLEFGDDAEFTLQRDAGIFRFRGDFDGTGDGVEGSGSFSFVADPDYLSRLADLGTHGLSDVQLMVLASEDLQLKTVSKLRDMGYGPFDDDELVTIAIFKVTPDFIKDMDKLGFDNISLDDLVAMRIHHVDEAFVKEMREAGADTDTVDDLIAWQVHSIDSEYIRDLRAEFGDDLELDDIMSFRIHGVDRDFAREMEEAGFGKLSPDELLSFKIHNMSTDYVKSLKEKGFKHLDADELLSWKIHNMSPEYIEAVRDAGYKNLDAGEMLSWKIHNMSPEYIEAVRDAGYKNLDAGEMLSWKIHNITPSYIKSIQALGYDLDADDLMAWKIHNVTGEFIEELAELGYRNISADDLVSMRIHGATPRWIRHLRERGIDNLDVDDLIKLRISGVDL
jgi:bla regulator protein blaR1